jgi:hypothetical protein
LESCIKTITVGFSKSKKFLPIGSWLIRLYEGTPYSHVYLKFYSQSLDRFLIYEAVGVGVRLIGKKEWSLHAEEVVSFDIPVISGNYISLLQHCVDHAGTDYGFLQNIGIPLARLLRLKSNPFQSGVNCAEEIYKVLNLSGYTVDKKIDLVTPKDIFNAIASKSII